jgi:hypothetical protein
MHSEILLPVATIVGEVYPGCYPCLRVWVVAALRKGSRYFTPSIKQATRGSAGLHGAQWSRGGRFGKGARISSESHPVRISGRRLLRHMHHRVIRTHGWANRSPAGKSLLRGIGHARKGKAST